MGSLLSEASAGMQARTGYSPKSSASRYRSQITAIVFENDRSKPAWSQSRLKHRMLEERQRRRLIREAQPDVSKDCGPGTVRHHT
jgi:hypothetical protein